MDKNKKTYKAVVYDEEKKCFGRRVTIEASDIDEAIRKMDSEYGEDKYIDLHNDDDADWLR